MDVGFDHHADDRGFAGGYLSGDGGGHEGLIEMVFERIS